MFKSILAFGIFVSQLWSVALASEGSLILPDQSHSNVELTVRSEQANINLENALRVFVGKSETCCEGKSPIAGHYAISVHSVIFDPAFDFIEGQVYTVMTREKDSDGSVVQVLKDFYIQPSSAVIIPEVLMIYPSGPELPENTLRFYFHFSTPVKPHLSAQFIKLVDANGVADTAAFMGLKQELWSEDRKRLTLLMDPGRIKRGVAQNLTLGPALIDGHTYSIIVEEGWPSASGLQKMPRFEKTFRVGPALRTLPDSNLWAIKSPDVLTSDPLVIEFDRAFDHQLAHSGLSVFDQDGASIPGKVVIESYERKWRFDPQNAWTAERIQVTIDARLEDVAGNNFKDLLDHSVESKIRSVDQEILFVELGQ